MASEPLLTFQGLPSIFELPLTYFNFSGSFFILSVHLWTILRVLWPSPSLVDPLWASRTSRTFSGPLWSPWSFFYHRNLCDLSKASGPPKNLPDSFPPKPLFFHRNFSLFRFGLRQFFLRLFNDVAKNFLKQFFHLLLSICVIIEFPNHTTINFNSCCF